MNKCAMRKYECRRMKDESMSECWRPKMRSWLRRAGFAVMSAIAFSAAAQKYPDKPVRLVVGFPPGGAADILGRIAAAQLTASLGEQVVVDNRGGAGGLVATEIAARAAPDGYTLLFT